MSNIKSAYGSNNQTITITLAALANTSAQASAAVDNTSDLFLDALVQVKVKTGSGTPANPKIINIYAYGTADGGTTYSDGATGTNAAITLTSPPNAILIGSINTPAASTTYKSGPLSVASAFGGVLPDHWGIIVENQEGQALDSTAGNHAAFYQGVYNTVA